MGPMGPDLTDQVAPMAPLRRLYLPETQSPVHL